MKGRVIAIVVIVACIGGRLLLDVFNQPEVSTPISINSAQVGDLLDKMSSLKVNREILDVNDKNAVTSTAALSMRISPLNNGYKVKTTVDPSSAFYSLHDGSNYILSNTADGWDIKNAEMLKRHLEGRRDHYEFDNYGNPFVKQLDTYNEFLDSATTAKDWLFLDLKLRPILAFNNRMFKKDESGGVSGSVSFLGHIGQQITQCLESTDSTDVLITSQYFLGEEEVSTDTLSYNLKSQQLNYIKSYIKLSDQYTLRQTISQ